MLKDTKIAKKYKPDEVKEMMFKHTLLPDDLKNVLSELGNEILPQYFDGTDKERKDIHDVMIEKATLMMRALETESHFGVTESFDKQYQGLCRELCSQIIKEYQCTTNLEKTLVEVITNSFIRVIDNSRRLNNELNGKSITPNRNIYIGNISKQLDRANRQYLNALTMLKQLKAPTIEMNIRANTAFIAQNQQVNVEKKTNEA